MRSLISYLQAVFSFSGRRELSIRLMGFSGSSLDSVETGFPQLTHPLKQLQNDPSSRPQKHILASSFQSCIFSFEHIIRAVVDDRIDDPVLDTGLLLANPRQNGFAQLLTPMNTLVLGVETAVFFYKTDARKSPHDPAHEIRLTEPTKIDRNLDACSRHDFAPSRINPSTNTNPHSGRSPNSDAGGAIANPESSTKLTDLETINCANPQYDRSCEQANFANPKPESTENLKVKAPKAITKFGQPQRLTGPLEIRNTKSNFDRGLHKFNPVSNAFREASGDLKLEADQATVDSRELTKSLPQPSQGTKLTKYQKIVTWPVSQANQKKNSRTTKVRPQKHEIGSSSSRQRYRPSSSDRIGPIKTPYFVPHQIIPQPVLWKIHYKNLLKRVTPLHCNHRDDDDYRIRWQTQYAQNQNYRYVPNSLYRHAQSLRLAFIQAQNSRVARERLKAKRRRAIKKKQRRRLYRLAYLQFKKGRIELLTQMGKLGKAYEMGWTANREWRNWRMLLKIARNGKRRRKRRKRGQMLDFDSIQRHAEEKIYEMRTSLEIEGNFSEKAF